MVRGTTVTAVADFERKLVIAAACALLCSRPTWALACVQKAASNSAAPKLEIVLLMVESLSTEFGRRIYIRIGIDSDQLNLDRFYARTRLVDALVVEIERVPNRQRDDRCYRETCGDGAEIVMTDSHDVCLTFCDRHAHLALLCSSL